MGVVRLARVANHGQEAGQPSAEFQPSPELLRVGAGTAGAAGDRSIHWQWTSGGGKAASIKLLFQATQTGEAIGIDPDSDRCLRGIASG